MLASTTSIDGVLSTSTFRADAVKVLLVDAEQASGSLLLDALIAEGYGIAYTDSGGDALVRAVSWQPTLIILDISLPDIDGREVIRLLRKHLSVAIIALSSRDREPEKIATLDLGADDFVCKPIKLGELMARVRAALRARMSFEPVTDVYQAGHLTIDAATRTVTLRDQSLRLTMKEFEILHILATVKGRVVKQRQLLEMVWGSVSAKNVQYLRVFIGRLRRKIEDNPDDPRLLVTERGVGYRLILGGPVHSE
jgi:two-component system KDP operon response regulator KdpE